MSDQNVRARDFHVETIAPHVAAALRESNVDPAGADDPAFWAQGLEPLRVVMEAVRQAQRNADPEARRSILDDPSIGREIDRLRVAARALELLRDDARQALGVAPDDGPKPAEARRRPAAGPGPTAETDAEDDERPA